MTLGAGLGIAFATVFIAYRWRNSPPLTPREHEVLDKLADLIVPADTVSPGAGELGIGKEIVDAMADQYSLRRLARAYVAGTHDRLLLNARKRSLLRKLTREGIVWLNIKAQESGSPDFLSLGNEGQNQILSQAEAAPPGSVERVFFRRIRAMTFEGYYAREESWRGLCYAGPPQPLGFPDYTEPPKECTWG